MPRRKIQLETGQIYHIVIRALDDNLIFKNIRDYYRGIFCLYEFNNLKPVNISIRRRDRAIEKKKEKLIELGARTIFVDEREKMVEVLAFCFMPNHIHILIKQIKDGGISKFMQKVGGGYGRYFNDKYQRKGHVFQDAFVAVHIEDDRQFMAVVSYIFTNPIALIEPGWKEFGIRNHSTKQVLKFLEEYRWSSYQDCIGIKNFPSVTERGFLLEIMGGVEGLKNIIRDWVEQKKDVKKHTDLFLE